MEWSRGVKQTDPLNDRTAPTSGGSQWPPLRRS